ncbi:MAG TPA: zinc-binding dehydrogenase [Burkholderiales bacterium]|nr:zinc-binding dehydrogenase [Burkholderiales bacterium]
MKSYWILERGSESVLEAREVPMPQPKAGEVVVEVHAAGLNRGELIVGGAVHGGAEKLGGTEASGVIHAVGPGVTAWKVGDRVMGRARGTFAQYSAMFEGQIMRMPERLSWEEAAAIPSGFLTAYEATVRYGGLESGEWLLVAGASSGVGVCAIQIARVLGARSIGTTTSPDKGEKLKAIGCDLVVDSRSPDFARSVKQATTGGADLGVNLVGGSVFPQLLRSMAYEGRIAIVGYVDREYLSQIDLADVHLNRIHVFGISNAKLPPEKRFETTRGFVRDILPALEDGRISPVVDRVFAFDELPAAKAYMESNAMVGKVVVKVA